ncbi:hypothetical protein T01_979 [Trichinella spiralis]|uniref:Uncharacterized protein n=1 Tax=Trichinella spiralis TaxID=6334 RepID=A0A0V1BJP3_TRISP|nr:hypothetical protein T01_979 [Trichinella spiralis]
MEFRTIENRLQQLFSVMYSENILQRYHLPRSQTNECALTDDKAPL